MLLVRVVKRFFNDTTAQWGAQLEKTNAVKKLLKKREGGNR